MLTQGMATESANGLSEPLRDINAVCEKLSITPTIAYGLIRQGMPHVKLNARVLRFNMAEVQSWLDSRRGGSI